jgi:hypothetical protein
VFELIARSDGLVLTHFQQSFALIPSAMLADAFILRHGLGKFPIALEDFAISAFFDEHSRARSRLER